MTWVLSPSISVLPIVPSSLTNVGSPAKNKQAIGRVYRPGQLGAVQLIYIEQGTLLIIVFSIPSIRSMVGLKWCSVTVAQTTILVKMKQIPLTQSKVTLVEDGDFEFLSQYRWYANLVYDKWYARTSMGTGKIYMHQLLLRATEVDHINGDSLDNRRSNLRSATRSQNAANRAKAGGMTSQYKGVSWDKANQKWRSTIMVDYKQVSLGRFESEHDAALAYNIKAFELYGEFAVLNEIE